MRIKTALFVKSAPTLKHCPDANRPEYAFIGRSNVGKSSLINMLVERKSLAKTSSTPGKTQYINYFDINESWYLVDLPGLGYAKVSKTKRKAWKENIITYLLNRRNLLSTFLLIDIRVKPQLIDIAFMNWMGENALPFVIVFTKTDKLKTNALKAHLENYKTTLLESWEELPQIFLSSAVNKTGKEELLKHINETNKVFYSTTNL